MHKKLSSKDGLKLIFGWVLFEGTVYAETTRASSSQYHMRIIVSAARPISTHAF
jgi:hypothetical protein